MGKSPSSKVSASNRGREAKKRREGTGETKGRDRISSAQNASGTSENTYVVDSGLISNVTIVRLVQILPIPATLEVNLGTQPIPTRGIEHPRLFLQAHANRQARKGDSVHDWPTRILRGTISHSLIVRSPRRLISREYLEAFREWDGVVPVGTTTEIVGHGSIVRDVDERAVRVLVVE